MITVAIVYWNRHQEADEIRLAIDSIKRNLSGVKNIVVCGDHPGEWYTGDFISSPRVTKRTAQKNFGVKVRRRKWLKWVDQTVKLDALIKSDLVSDSFLWTYDDTFFMKQNAASKFATMFYKGSLNPEGKKSSWSHVRARTHSHLTRELLPIRDFSNSHLPCVFEKLKLRLIIDRFDTWNNPRVIESLYGNVIDGDRQEIYTGLSQYVSRAKNNLSWDGSEVLNVGSGYVEMKEEIERMLNVKSSAAISAADESPS